MTTPNPLVTLERALARLLFAPFLLVSPQFVPPPGPLELLLPANGLPPSNGESVFPGATWGSRSPAELGLDDAKLTQLASNVGGDGVVIKDGYLVKAWGTQSRKADWASSHKAVACTLLLFAVQEGLLSSVDDLVRPYVQQVFPGQDLTPKDHTMTFRHLTNMMSGYALPEEPGAAWGYNDYAITLYMRLLFEGVFGQAPNEVALAPHRLGALQFQDGSLLSGRSGFGVNTTPRDFARIGWFWLNRGNWNGEQILPADLLDDLRRPQVPADLPRTAGGVNDYLGTGSIGAGTDSTPYGPGIYGFNSYFNGLVGASGNLAWPDAPLDLMMTPGSFNQKLVVVIPGLNMVAAARGNWGTWAPGQPGDTMNNNFALLREAVR